MLTRRRRGERGQALLIALAFLGLFTLWGVAVLRLAGTAQGTLSGAAAADATRALSEAPAALARSAVAAGAGCDGLTGSVTVGGSVVSFGPMTARDAAGAPISCPTAAAPAGPLPGTYAASGTVAGSPAAAGSSVEIGVGPAPGKTLSTRAFNYR
ncbi:MAG TPA: hypothetical protein VH134_12285 [Candidatus Dormibacteraeota bacterium]|nr:hypothetical protein [Candidatus Dormibacteraeota bacterium]